MNSIQLKAKLAAKEPVFGSIFCHFHCPAICRVARDCGFDYLIFDTEHSRPGIETISWLMQAARDIDFTAIVRDPPFEGQWPTRYLDVGAKGILMPRIETPEEGERLVRMLKYPPDGERGWGIGGGNDDYTMLPDPEYPARTNREIIIVIQLETRKGWEARKEILSVPGIDAVFVGPNDLALSLGLPTDYSHPTVIRAMDDIFECALENGVAPGNFCFDVESSREWISRGSLLLAFGSDMGLMCEAAVEGLREIRGE